MGCLVAWFSKVQKSMNVIGVDDTTSPSPSSSTHTYEPVMAMIR